MSLIYGQVEGVLKSVGVTAKIETVFFLEWVELSLNMRKGQAVRWGLAKADLPQGALLQGRRAAGAPTVPAHLRHPPLLLPATARFRCGGAVAGDGRHD